MLRCASFRLCRACPLRHRAGNFAWRRDVDQARLTSRPIAMAATRMSIPIGVHLLIEATTRPGIYATGSRRSLCDERLETNSVSIRGKPRLQSAINVLLAEPPKSHSLRGAIGVRSPNPMAELCKTQISARPAASRERRSPIAWTTASRLLGCPRTPKRIAEAETTLRSES